MSEVRSAARRFLDLASNLRAVALWRAKRFSDVLAQSSEPELRLLEHLALGRVFVDVGANRGMYAVHALRCGAPSVIAVEPIPELANRLTWLLGRRGVVHQMALSSSEGVMGLTIPTVGGVERPTRAALAGALPIDGRRIEVSVCRLDQLDVPNDAVVKIDVEGHELDVLDGASRLLGQRPPAAFLVESEERHGRGLPGALTRRLVEHGYEGWAVLPRRLIPASDFNPDLHQMQADVVVVDAGGFRPDTYANNFCFVRSELVPSFIAGVGDVGFTMASVA